MKTHALWVRRQVEVNTDPQRRCYNGCHLSSEMVWTEWEYLFASGDLDGLMTTKAVFEEINPGCEYRITEAGERP